MEGVEERIKELIDDQGLSNTEFAKETNLNPAIISHILSGRNKPSLQVIHQIKQSFTNVNLDYLISGSGTLYNDLTNVKSNDFQMQQPVFSGFPMEGIRVVSEPGTVPKSAPIEKEKTVDSTPASALSEEKDMPPPSSQNPSDKQVEKIVWFYTDGTFKAYHP